ncbi:hypothetical protein [Nocardia aurantiaca]|uniref:PPE domain-containing protein n=1 Tax=Nocardia aurantiaca TaxID=2675850 RepID=A0A6I3L631_9NOCA|nr:hypothetical protein [Nocardia aurantiaca]MTE16124.1 hypothetical protein [Nocardia aurantiaca]
MEPEALRRRARLSQSGAEHEQSRIAVRGIDPDYIRQLEHFARFSHQQIHDRVQAMDPGAMHSAAQIWISIANSMFGALSALHATVQNALSAGMSGHIADAAEAAARQFVRDATDVAEIAHSTGHRVIAAAYGAEAVRNTVPPPVTHGAAKAANEQYQLALAALDANYVPIYPPAGAGIPAFFEVMTPGNTDATAENRSGAADSGGNPPAPDTSPLRTPSASDTQAAPGGVHDPAAATNPAAAQAIPGTAARTDVRNPADLNRPSWDRQRSETPQPTDIETGPATTTPPGRPFVPPIRPTTPFSPRPAPAAPDPGRSFPGPPDPELSTQPKRLESPDGAGPLGAGAPAGMFAPGARAAADPDSAHRTPPWLIRNREDELLGTPLPHLPATLGAEFPAARNDLMVPPDDLG